MEPFSIVIHCSVSLSKERKEIGEFEGIKFITDPGLPDDEIRIVRNGKVVKRFNMWLGT